MTKDEFIQELIEENEKRLRYNAHYRQWRAEHPEQMKLRRKRYYENHIGREKQYSKQYRKTHFEERKALARKWRINNPEKAAEISRREGHRRQRNLGFIPLNNYFKGSAAHHLDRNYIVYIPEEVHRSIYHCLETGVGMEEINKFAMDFAKKEIVEWIRKRGLGLS